MTNFLSFNFDDVKLDTLKISDIPFNQPLHCVVRKVTMENVKGNDKFVIQQDVYIDPGDDTRVVPFRQYVGPTQGFILAKYLNAAGQDVRELSGEQITAESLDELFKDLPFIGTFTPNVYEGRTNHRLNDIRAFTPSE